MAPFCAFREVVPAWPGLVLSPNNPNAGYVPAYPLPPYRPPGRGPRILMIASAVANDGMRSPAISLEIVEWLMPVRIPNARWLIRRSAMASRTQPPKSPSVMRLGTSRSSTSRCPLQLNHESWFQGRGQPRPWKLKVVRPTVRAASNEHATYPFRAGRSAVGTSAHRPTLARGYGGRLLHSIRATTERDTESEIRVRCGDVGRGADWL